ncbi:MAG: class 1 fructose-bisphosphatase [Haloferacaceae archaeon]
MSDPAVERVVETVATAAGAIREGLPERRGAAGVENPSGEEQKAADVHADELLVERLGALGEVGTVASEERAEPVDVGDGVAVALDPLDGSSNLASNNLMGTVFGVFDRPLPAGGDALLGAGYVLYGPTTTMVVASEGSATEYGLDGGSIRVIDDDVTLPDDPTVYGFGGRTADWPADFAAFADEVQGDPGLKLRYGGAMVGDVNQVLAHGGVFAYPALDSAPDGKLRLQFEAIPVAAVVEAAGGASTDGARSLLDVTPDELHQRVPVHVGNESLVRRVEETVDRD